MTIEARVDGAQPPRAPMDLLPDELMVARAQIEDGLAALAERTLRRLLDEAARQSAAQESLDAPRALLAEALWRQGRPRAAGAVLADVRGDGLRSAPLMRVIEADSVAAGGDPERATALMDALLEDVGVEVTWEVRGGVPSRLPWPDPAELSNGDVAAGRTGPESVREAEARARLHAGRQAFDEGEDGAAEDEIALALRLDPTTAGDALALVEPRVHASSSARRLILYGDLLAAIGRGAEAEAAYESAISAERDRAATPKVRDDSARRRLDRSARRRPQS